MSDFTLPACTVEDGSLPGQMFPCIWDAATMGNGEGVSFVLDYAGDVPHYVTETAPDGTIYTSDEMPVVSVDPSDPAAAPEYVAETLTSSEATVPDPALAETGMNVQVGSGIALALIVIGVGITRAARRRNAHSK